MKKSILLAAFFIFFTARAEATTLQQQINNRIQVSIKNLNLEITDWLTDRVLALPIHTEMDEEQLTFISTKFIEIINKNKIN